MAGAAAFQIGITLSVGPPLSYDDARGGLSGSRSAALTYSGNGLTALPAAATCSIYRATDHAWKDSSASVPKTSCQVPFSRTVFLSALSTSGLSSSAGTGPSNSFWEVGEKSRTLPHDPGSFSTWTISS